MLDAFFELFDAFDALLEFEALLMLDALLEFFELLDAFDAISDGTNITKSKPDPEVFLKAAEMLGEKPENCLVVEDALAGIDAAYAGDFQSAGIGDAAGHSQVTYPIQAFKDLLSICSIC